MRSVQPYRRGFTIIEMVVVIGVIMVLIGIFLPVLGGARQTAETTAQSSRLRQLAIVIFAYSSDYDDMYPFADTRPYYFPPEIATDDPRIGDHWALSLINGGYTSFEDAVSEDVYDVRNTAYSYALHHDPKTMTPTTIEPWELRNCVPVRQFQATYPADKGILHLSQIAFDESFEPWCCLPNSIPGPVAFADGSLSSIKWTDLPEPSPLPILDMGRVVISTWDGIRGRDR